MIPPRRTCDEILQELKTLADPAVIATNQRFGVTALNPLYVKIPDLRRIARGVCDHDLALQLWASGYHEARLLASMVADPALVTRAQMDQWAMDFESWDLCDGVCLNLFGKTTHAMQCALEWPDRPQEFVRRAGFVMMAVLALHDKQRADADFIQFLPIIVHYATDGRNFVKKAVNWALRQVGKRNLALCQQAMQTARTIRQVDSPAARWIASDALRELQKGPRRPIRSRQDG